MMKEITQNGMTVRWQLNGGQLQIEAFAPTQGWVAVGFNTEDNIAGSNLIMGCVRTGKVTIEDQFVTGFGKHPRVESLGGKSAIRLLQGREDKQGTHISFSISVKKDAQHIALLEGKEIVLIMAFSRSDDFAHHSMMRVHKKIIL